MISTKRNMSQGTFDILPLALSVIPWGILCGTISINMGFTFWQAQAMSMFVFAGAAQLSAMTLISSGASLMPISGSVFAISSRHLLYSLDLRKDVYGLPLKWRIPLAFFLTDEVYAVTKSYIHKHDIFSPIYSLTAGIVFYLIWNLSTFAGIMLGKNITNIDKWGLDFAVVAVFIAITAPHFKNKSMLITTIFSALSAIYFKNIYPDIYIVIVAFIGMTAGYIASEIWE